MNNVKKTTGNSTYYGSERPSAKPSADYINHGLKPGSPSPRPTVKPTPSPKTK